MLIAAFILALLSCVLLLLWLHYMERAEAAEDEPRCFKPTRRQLRQWKRERLEWRRK
jgi:hypothetical protein